MSEVYGFLVDFVASVINLLPWFVVAIGLSAVLGRMSLDVIAERVFKRNGVYAVLLTAAVGAFSPFCSFTVIPIIRRFLISGVPLSAVMAFWIASPTMDPEIFAISAAALGIPVALARLTGAVLLSVGAGLIVLAMERRGFFAAVLRGSATVAAEPSCASASSAPVVATAVGAGGGTGTVGTTVETGTASCAAAATACSGEAKADPRSTGAILLADLKGLRLGQFLRDMWNDGRPLAGWLLVAIAAAVAIERYVPTTIVSAVLGAGNSLLAVPLAAVVSVPLYLNGVGAIPVVQGLMNQGMSGAAAIAFLLGGAVTTVPAMVAVRSVVNNRAFLAYLGFSFIGSILIAFLFVPLL